MGLLAEFTMDDLGYAEETEIMGVFIDYSHGCQIFADTFLEVAQGLVPVDTGRLLGSIDAYADDFGCSCEADTEYAQYVEYGTSHMGAQPYFEPAIEEALSAAIPYWDDAVDMALEEEEELLEEMAEAEAQVQSQGKVGFVGGILGAIFTAIILAPLIIIGEILKDAFINRGSNGNSHFSKGISGGGGLKGSADNIEIIIT